MEKNKIYNKREFHDFKELVNYAATTYANKAAFRLKEQVKGKNVRYVDISYAQFKKDIEALGTSLVNMGLQSKKVAIIAPNRYEWCVSYLAITTGNMIVVPLDKSLPENEIESSIIRSEVEAVIYDKKYQGIFEKLKKDNSSNLKYYICMDEVKEEELCYLELIHQGKESLKN